MRYDALLAWRNVRARPLQTLITVLIVAVAVGLPLTVLALGDGARQGIIRASDPFGVLVVGPKGSAQELVLNTILLQGVPLGNMPYDIYAQLRADPRVALAIPMAKGDSVGNSPLIGTTEAFFELRATLNSPPAFRITAGRLFAADFEAVLGAKAAAQLGLRIGDAFQSQHGRGPGIASDVHKERYTVVGILDVTDTPYDMAVYTTLGSIWEAHQIGADAAFRATPDPSAAAENQITAILVKPTGFAEANRLWQTFQNRTDAQAAFPGKELGGLFDLLGQGERILGIVGYLVMGMAALSLFLSIYSATLSREHTLAIMRGVGGRRLNVFRVVLFEALFVTVIGAVVGRVLGYLTALIVATLFTRTSAIPLPIRYLTAPEAALWVLPLLIGAVAGLIPAVMAYRTNVVEKLFPS
jgi:putative ABC transport system permease protein